MVTDEQRAEMEADLAEMRKRHDELATAPKHPVGDNWRASRAEKRATIGKHIDRCEQLLVAP